MCTGYLVLLVVVFGGLLQPAQKPVPGRADPLPEHTAPHPSGDPGDARPPAPSSNPGAAMPVGHHSSPAPAHTAPVP
ncbi:hypothetical protein [Streptomyces sp. NPDC048650]|uniref:hypothetical protein n=1 Tax=Streptomyces sp. NPDC048650 TaxID=3365583 RepID=UPI00372077A0